MKVCALTGVAARLVGGITLYNTFKLPVQKDGRMLEMSQLSGNHLRILRIQSKDIQFLFRDEISMIPYEMLCMIESKLTIESNDSSKFRMNYSVESTLLFSAIFYSCLQFADIKFLSSRNAWFQLYIFGDVFPFAN